jgi:hypothetical protein
MLRVGHNPQEQVGLAEAQPNLAPTVKAHLTLSTARIHGTELELKHNKAGVSATAPRVPEHSVHSLPATLRMLGLSPILSYSKGSRGLSV